MDAQVASRVFRLWEPQLLFRVTIQPSIHQLGVTVPIVIMRPLGRIGAGPEGKAASRMRAPVPIEIRASLVQHGISSGPQEK